MDRDGRKLKDKPKLNLMVLVLFCLNNKYSKCHYESKVMTSLSGLKEFVELKKEKDDQDVISEYREF